MSRFVGVGRVSRTASAIVGVRPSMNSSDRGFDVLVGVPIIAFCNWCRTVPILPVSPWPPAFMSEALGVGIWPTSDIALSIIASSFGDRRRAYASDHGSNLPSFATGVGSFPVSTIRIGYVEPAPPPFPSRIPSDAIGVANLEPDEPASLALMVGPDVSSTDHKRPAGVADGLQSIDDPVCASSSEISAILKSEPTRPAFVDKSDSLEVEAASLAVDAFAFGVRAADVLAGRRADDDVGKSDTVPNKSVCGKGCDVVINRHSGVVL